MVAKKTHHQGHMFRVGCRLLFYCNNRVSQTASILILPFTFHLWGIHTVLNPNSSRTITCGVFRKLGSALSFLRSWVSWEKERGSIYELVLKVVRVQTHNGTTRCKEVELLFGMQEKSGAEFLHLPLYIQFHIYNPCACVCMRKSYGL